MNAEKRITKAHQAQKQNDAMDKSNHLRLGENGSAEHTASGVGESRVALFFALLTVRFFALLFTHPTNHLDTIVNIHVDINININ